MKLALVIGSTDYTDYVESIRLENHAEGILQSHVPSASMVIVLSTELPMTINPPNMVTWGADLKYLTMNIVKITRGKGMTEVRTERLPVDLFEGFVKGCFLINSRWNQLFSSYDLTVDSGLIREGQQMYVDTPENILLGMVAISYKQSMIDNTFPKPWAKRSQFNSLSDHTIRQLQTLAEFNSRPAKNVAKVEIDYDDVIQEEEITSHVDPTLISTSKLGDKRKGLSFDYTSTTTWSNAFNEVRLYECADGNAYAVGIITGSGTTAKTELHMSDGTVRTVTGVVAGVTPEWYYRCYTPNGTQFVMEICSLADDSTLAVEIAVADVSGGSNRILDILATHNEVVRIRQTLTLDTNPGDLILFGKPVQIGGTSTLLGVAYYKDAIGSPTMALISANNSVFSGMDGCWLLSTYQSGGIVTARYGKQRHVFAIDIRYNGVCISSTYRHYSNMSDTSIYPVSAAKTDSLYLTGYKTSAPYYRNGEPNASPLLTPPITWSSIGGDQAQLGWFIPGYDQVVFKTSGNHFGWRDRLYLPEFASSDVEMRKSKMIAVVAPTVSMLIFGGGSQNEVRTIVIEASPLPENTFDLTKTSIETGNRGEESELNLPFVLQGGSQAWPLIPTNRTRLSVQVSALKFTAQRSESIRFNAGQSAYATGGIYYTRHSQPQPDHKYYMSVEVSAPSGISATKASFAWASERYPTYSHPVVVDLNNTPATVGWVKKSNLVQIPSDFTDYVSSPGVFSDNAAAQWRFRKPMLVDLTEKYGAGNEPDKAWCDANLAVDDDNMLSNCSLDDTDSYSWSLSNAVYYQEAVTDRLKIDNDDIVLPQIGSPVLYHRTTPKYTLDVTTAGGWERMYLPVAVQQGKKYVLKFGYKVNSNYVSLGWATHSTVPVQVLSAVPSTDGPGDDIEIAAADTSLTAMNDYEEKVISFTAPSNTVYLSINFGFAADGQDVSISYTDFSLCSVDSDENILGTGTDLNTWAIAQYPIAVVSTDLGEEGIVLGFDYDFDGSAQLYVDILLLGQPKPWSTSVVIHI